MWNVGGILYDMVGVADDSWPNESVFLAQKTFKSERFGADNGSKSRLANWKLNVSLKRISIYINGLDMNHDLEYYRHFAFNCHEIDINDCILSSLSSFDEDDLRSPFTLCRILRPAP